MTLNEFKEVWIRAQRVINEREMLFSELDAATGGDGDHGTAIVAAMKAIVNASGDDFKTYITNMANKLETEASGSTSSLYGAWFEGMANSVAEGITDLDPQAIVAMFEGGLEELQFSTKARVGDKTLMDALIPATVAIASAVDGGDKTMFEMAAKVARDGSNASAAMQAKYGRARNLGVRSIGPIDAGSSSMATIFEAFIV